LNSSNLKIKNILDC